MLLLLLDLAARKRSTGQLGKNGKNVFSRFLLLNPSPWSSFQQDTTQKTKEKVPDQIHAVNTMTPEQQIDLASVKIKTAKVELETES